MYKLIERAKDTKYITHYKKLEEDYDDPKILFKEMNETFYKETWNNIKQATAEKTKIKLYHEIYNTAETMPHTSLSLLCKSTKYQNIVTKYVMSSHELHCETGKWSRTPKGERYCKQCNEQVEEDLSHFIFNCARFQHIRASYPEFLLYNSLSDFFNWELGGIVLQKLHMERK